MGKRKERKVDITSPTYLFIPFLNMFSICGNRKKKDSCDYLIKKKCERFTNCGITTPGDSDYNALVCVCLSAAFVSGWALTQMCRIKL